MGAVNNSNMVVCSYISDMMYVATVNNSNNLMCVVYSKTTTKVLKLVKMSRSSTHQLT